MSALESSVVAQSQTTMAARERATLMTKIVVRKLAACVET